MARKIDTNAMRRRLAENDPQRAVDLADSLHGEARKLRQRRGHDLTAVRTLLLESREYHRKAAEGSLRKHQVSLAHFLIEEGSSLALTDDEQVAHKQELKSLLEKLLESRPVPPHFLTELACLLHEEVNLNSERIIGLLKESIQLRSASALAVLGSFYLRGIYVPLDSSAGFQLLLKAQQGPEFSAQADFRNWLDLELAGCYREGLGTEKNLELAYAHALRAAERGDRTAQLLVGQCLQRSVGVPKDVSTAFTWIAKAAEGGDPLARFSLAECFAHGIGIEKDLAQANCLFTVLASEGFQEAAQRLSSLVEGGAEENEEQDDEWILTEAARNDDDFGPPRGGGGVATLVRPRMTSTARARIESRTLRPNIRYAQGGVALQPTHIAVRDMRNVNVESLSTNLLNLARGLQEDPKSAEVLRSRYPTECQLLWEKMRPLVEAESFGTLERVRESHLLERQSRPVNQDVSSLALGAVTLPALPVEDRVSSPKNAIQTEAEAEFARGVQRIHEIAELEFTKLIASKGELNTLMVGLSGRPFKSFEQLTTLVSDLQIIQNRTKCDFVLSESIGSGEMTLGSKVTITCEPVSRKNPRGRMVAAKIDVVDKTARRAKFLPLKLS